MKKKEFKDGHGFYCAFCRTPRTASLKKHIDAWNVLGSAAISGIAMLALWERFDARVFIIFAFVLSMSEMITQLRWRMSLLCQTCGFDPVLYLRDAAEAARRVRAKLDERKKNPGALLAKPLNLPVIRVPASADTVAAGKLSAKAAESERPAELPQ